MSNWSDEGREGRLLLGDLDGRGVIGGTHRRSKHALEFGRLQEGCFEWGC